jgi:hypothetical protein
VPNLRLCKNGNEVDGTAAFSSHLAVLSSMQCLEVGSNSICADGAGAFSPCLVAFAVK